MRATSEIIHHYYRRIKRERAKEYPASKNRREARRRSRNDQNSECCGQDPHTVSHSVMITASSLNPRRVIINRKKAAFNSPNTVLCVWKACVCCVYAISHSRHLMIHRKSPFRQRIPGFHSREEAEWKGNGSSWRGGGSRNRKGKGLKCFSQMPNGDGNSFGSSFETHEGRLRDERITHTYWVSYPVLYSVSNPFS